MAGILDQEYVGTERQLVEWDVTNPQANRYYYPDLSEHGEGTSEVRPNGQTRYTPNVPVVYTINNIGGGIYRISSTSTRPWVAAGNSMIYVPNLNALVGMEIVPGPDYPVNLIVSISIGNANLGALEFDFIIEDPPNEGDLVLIGHARA